MLKIAVCDDNEIVLKELCEQIEGLLTVEHRLFLYQSGEALLFNASTDKSLYFDIVITDIRMPGCDGIKAAELLQQACPYTQFIFVTSYTEYIQDSFSVSPVYYILKPVEEKYLEAALNKALSVIENKRNEILRINSKGEAFCINCNEIIYLESCKHNVTIYKRNGTITITSKLDDISLQLPAFFVRCHKSYCVNMNFIDNITKYQAELNDSTVVPIAKAKFNSVKQSLFSYFGYRF